jgi:hypothetical protein
MHVVAHENIVGSTSSSRCQHKQQQHHKPEQQQQQSLCLHQSYKHLVKPTNPETE